MPRHQNDDIGSDGERQVRAIGLLFRRKFKRASFGELSTFYTNCVLILVGTVTALIYSFQLFEMKRATDAAESAAVTAKQALVDGQRAVVSAETFTVARQTDKQGQVDGLQFTVGWKNSGSTATEQLETWSNWRPVPIDARVDKAFNFTDEWMKSGKPVPHEHGFATPQKIITYYPMVIPRYLAEPVADGKVALVFWGRATYKDVFSVDVHTSEYCLTVVGFDGAKPFDPRSEAGTTYPRFLSCPVHNCHDEECKAE